MANAKHQHARFPALWIKPSIFAHLCWPRKSFVEVVRFLVFVDRLDGFLKNSVYIFYGIAYDTTFEISLVLIDSASE